MNFKRHQGIVAGTQKRGWARRFFTVRGALFLVAFGLLAGSLIPALFHSFASAATGINDTINFQGKVVNSDGTNVADDDYDFVFKIYTVATDGTEVWTETWNSGTAQVTVTDGIFQVALGTHTDLPGSIDFNTDNIYLGVEFDGDGEMEPRVRFTSVPQAFNADALDGIDSGSFLRSDASDSFTSGTLTFDDSTVLAIGGGGDLQLTHNGTNSVLTSATGDLIIDNTLATGSSIMRLGTDTSATDFQVQNNSESAVFTINGAGALTATGTITFSNLDCTGNDNGGVLTADASGNITCDDDDSSAGGAGTLQESYDAGSAGNQTITLDATQDSIVINNPSSSGSDSAFAFMIDQDDTSGVAGLVIDSESTDDNALRITHAGDTSNADAALHITAESGAGAAYFYSNIGSDQDAAIVEIVNDNTAADQAALFINNDATSNIAVDIDSLGTTTGYVLQTTTAALTTGKAIVVNDSSGAMTSGELLTFLHSAGDPSANKTGSLVSITSDRTVADNTVSDNFDLVSVLRQNDRSAGMGSFSATGSVLRIENASAGGPTDSVVGIELVMAAGGTGDAIFIDQNGNGISLNIDAESTTTDAIYASADVLTTGDVLEVNSDSTSLTSGRLLHLTHAPSGVLANKSGNLVRIESTRSDSDSSGSVADDYDVVLIARESETLGAGTFTATGSLLRLDNNIDVFGGAITDSVIGIELHMSSGGTGDAIFIDSNSTGAIALNIDSEATTADIINISAAPLTTSIAIDISDLNALTTGKGLNIVSNSASTSGRSLVTIHNDHASATGTTALEVIQDSTGDTARFDNGTSVVSLSNSSNIATFDNSAEGISIAFGGSSDIASFADGTNGLEFGGSNIAYLYDGTYNISFGGDNDAIAYLFEGSNNVVLGGTGWGANVYIEQSRDEIGLHIEQGGNGTALYLDSSSTTADTAHIDSTALTSGDALQISVDTDALTTGQAIRVRGTSTGTTDVFTVNGAGAVSLAGDITMTDSTPAVTVNSTATLTFGDGTDTLAINFGDNALVFTSGSNSYTFDADSGPAYAGNARPTRQVTLSPEYEGATLTGDGSSNVGTLTSDFCENGAHADIPNTNTGVCNTSGDIHNYYSWTTGEGSAQDYDVWVRWRVPDNFSAWASNPIDVYGKRTDATNNAVTVFVYDTTGALENSGGTQVAGTTWTSTTVEGTFAGTYTAGSYMTIRIQVTADTGGDSVQVGEINLDYLANN